MLLDVAVRLRRSFKPSRYIGMVPLLVINEERVRVPAFARPSRLPNPDFQSGLCRRIVDFRRPSSGSFTRRLSVGRQPSGEN